MLIARRNKTHNATQTQRQFILTTKRMANGVCTLDLKHCAPEARPVDR